MSNMSSRVTIERHDTEFEIEVDYSIFGEYRRASWGYDGGDPEEHPEVEIESVHPVNAKTGEVRAKEIKLTPAEEDRLYGTLLAVAERQLKDDRDEARISAHEARMDYDGDY